MKRLSMSVFFQKWVLPFLYVAGVVFLSGENESIEPFWSREGAENQFPWLPVVALVGGFFVWKKFFYPLMDVVLDSGEALFFRRGSKELVVPYSGVNRVSSISVLKGFYVYVYFNNKTIFGSEVNFYPKVTSNLKHTNEMLKVLIQKMEQVNKNN